MKEMNEIDNLFKDKLADLDSGLPDNVWENIDSKRTGKKFGLWILIIPIALIVTTIWIFTSSSNNNNNNQIANIDSSHTITKIQNKLQPTDSITDNTKFISSEKDKTNKNKNNDDEQTLAIKTKFEKNNTNSDSVPSINTLVNTGKINVTTSDSTKVGDNNTAMLQTPPTSITDTMKSAPLKNFADSDSLSNGSDNNTAMLQTPPTSITDTVKSAPSINFAGYDSISAVKTNNNSSETDNTTETFTADQLTNNEQSSLDSNKIKTDSTSTNPLFKVDSNKTATQLNHNDTTSNNSEHKVFAYLELAPVYPLSSITFTSTGSSNSTPAPGISVNAGMGYQFNEKISLTTGIGYKRFSEKFSFAQQAIFPIIKYDSIGFYIDSATSLPVTIYDTLLVDSVVTGNVSGKLTYSSVSIPILLQYQIWQRNKFSIFAKLGGSFNITSITTGYAKLTTPIVIRESLDSIVTTTNFFISGMAGIGCSYVAGKRTTFYLEPQLSYSLSNIIHIYDTDNKLIILGLNVGIKISL